jgi:hypothetical protein
MLANFAGHWRFAPRSGCGRIPALRRSRSRKSHPDPWRQHRNRRTHPRRPRPRRRRKPEGFFDAFGRWSRDFKAKVDEANAKWKASVDETNAKLKASADETNAKLKQSVEESNARWRELQQRNEKAVKEAAAAQKEAAEAFKNLANTRIIEGRQACETAPNGSPDCQAAAEVICKGKGFSIGKSADITTSRKCSARALLQRDESECRTETVVIKAACQ